MRPSYMYSETDLAGDSVAEVDDADAPGEAVEDAEGASRAAASSRGGRDAPFPVNGHDAPFTGGLKYVRRVASRVGSIDVVVHGDGRAVVNGHIGRGICASRQWKAMMLA